MFRPCTGLAVLTAAAVLGAAPVALAQTMSTGDSVTATGTGQSRVVPSDRHNNASILAAYAAAEKASISGAISAAHSNALAYAAAAGLSLGAVESVSDQTGNGGYFYGPGASYGPFGPNQFCGTERVPVFKKVGTKRKLVRFKHVHRCIVPSYATLALTVTYTATPTGS